MVYKRYNRAPATQQMLQECQPPPIIIIIIISGLIVKNSVLRMHLKQPHVCVSMRRSRTWRYRGFQGRGFPGDSKREQRAMWGGRRWGGAVGNLAVGTRGRD